MKRQDIRLLAQARNGDLRARCEVGRRYLLGTDGFVRHVPSGIDHLRHAATVDPAAAAKVLAACLPLHELLQAGERAALALAAGQGLPRAQRLHGIMLCVEQRAAEGAEWLRRAVEGGDRDAARVLAAIDAADDLGVTHAALRMLAETGQHDGVARPPDVMAVAMWAADEAARRGQARHLAAALGAACALTPPGAPMADELAEALVDLMRLVQGPSQAGDASPAVWDGVPAEVLREALERRAAQDDRDAAFMLARALCGQAVPGLPPAVFAQHHNVRKGAAFMLRAADAGEDEAWMQLYLLHSDHRLSVANPQMARFFLEKAAARGRPDAQRKLGALVLRSAASLAESEQAIGWLHRAAAQGDALAGVLLSSLVLPVQGTDAEAAWALGLVRAQDARLAARLALARAFGLTKLEALCVDPAEGSRPWGLVVGRNPFVVQVRLAAPRAVPAVREDALDVLRSAAALFAQLPVEGDLRARSLRQRRLFERLGLDEALFFADASAMELESLRFGPKWAYRSRDTLNQALAA